MIPVRRFTPRFSRTLIAQCRRSRLHVYRQDCNYVSTISSNFVSPNDKAGFGQESLMRWPVLHSSGFQWFRFSSSSPLENENVSQFGSEQEKKTDAEAAASGNHDASVSDVKSESDCFTESSASMSETTKGRRKGIKRIAFSDSDSDLESDLSAEDLMKIVKEKEQILLTKQEELEKMKDKVLRTFAEMENVKDRTRRESENAKKFAIQNFAKGLLDVADNLGRASDASKTSFSKIDDSTNTADVVQQFKVLLEGVEMTEKQLIEVFKKFGLEKYNPVDEEFNPNRHNAVFQVPDASKPADHVAIVLKAGYMLHDRVVRPAEVGVTVAIKGEEGSES